LFEVTDGIYQVRGYDMANLTLIRSDHGYLVYDCTMCRETAEACLALARKKLGVFRIAGVLISHPHVDHYGGIGGVISREQIADSTLPLEAQFASGKVPVIVPKGFADAAIAENVFAGPAMGRRAQYQYGSLLPQGAEGRLAMGIGMGQSVGTVTYFAPTYEVGENVTLNLDGIEAQFQMTPGTEAPAEMNTYFPKYKALWMAENCTGTLHNLYTLRGAQVRDGKAWSDYIVEAYQSFGSETDVIFQSHNWPHWKDEIPAYMLNTAEIYKFIHDQTLHYLNLGYTANEIAAMIRLPEDLEKVWYTRQYYGTLKHDAKAVYQRYMGWYDANPVDLDPLPEEESAKKLMEYIALGSLDAIMEKARQDYAQGEYQWVAQIMKQVIYSDPSDMQARLLCADALEQLGYQAESGTWRNAYLTGALELRNGNQSLIAPSAGGMASTMTEWTVRMIFDNVGMRTDNNAAQNDDVEFDLIMSDLNESYHVRRVDGILLLFDGTSGTGGTRVTASKAALTMALMQGKMDGLQIEGDITVIQRLTGYMSAYRRDFNIVEP
jgi:alkyl sulfatase BDS1-like metallo-beta-lactamase superfamily hydrolase